MSGISVDEFELRFDTGTYEASDYWQIWQDGEFVASERTAVKAIEALASVADEGGWYTDADGNSWPMMAQEPITDITVLEKGDGVVFGERSTPLVVTSAAASASDEVQLRGPDGGEYWISCQPNHLKTIVIYPGYGNVDELVRIVAESEEE